MVSNFKVMNKLELICISLALILLCNACEKVIEFDIPEAEPLLVANSYITDQETIKVNLTSSLSYLDSSNELPSVSDAQVTVNHNGNVYTFEESADEPGAYYSVQPFTGTGEVSLQASAADYNTITASSMIPGAINGELELLEQIDENFEFRLTFNDVSNSDDYYHLLIVENSEFSEEGFVQYFVSNDEVLLEAETNSDFGEESYFGTSAVFTDFLFKDGQARIEFELELFDTENLDFEVHLIRSSRDYYEYHRTSILSAFSDSFFSQPVQVYSNIEDGIGVFAGYSVTKIPLEF